MLSINKTTRNILIGIIIVFVIYVVIKVLQPRQGFDPVPTPDAQSVSLAQRIVDGLSKYSDPTFSEYLDVLTQSQNTSDKLISISVYKSIVDKLKDKTLSVDFITSAM